MINSKFKYKSMKTKMKSNLKILKIVIITLLTFNFGFAFSQANHLVISQIYGGGGNSGSIYTNDFIELYNGTSDTVFLTGWSIQYASSTGSGWSASKFNLSGFIAPGRYYLIMGASGAIPSTSLPTPDLVSSPLLNMSGTNGKLALCNSTVALPALTCPFPNSSIVDFIGYGSAANCYETNYAPTLSNALGNIRANGGCTDTDNNSTDFSAITPNPRNSSSPLMFCEMKKLYISDMIPTSPQAGATFDIIVRSVNSANAHSNVFYNSDITLTSNGNAGVISGTVSGTITEGNDSVVISGVILPSVGTGVLLYANTLSPEFSAGDTSDLFNVHAVTPSVTTTLVFNIGIDSAVSGGEVVADGGAPVTARGVVFDIISSPELNATSDGIGIGPYISVMDNLLPNTLYYYRSYATNSAGTAYGGEFSFTTLLNVGISEKNNQNRVTLLNNSSKLFVLFDLNAQTDASIEVFDITGKKITGLLLPRAFKDRAELSLEGWGKGIFLISITAGSEKFSYKIIL
jgi:hypothetical protein